MKKKIAATCILFSASACATSERERANPDGLSECMRIHVRNNHAFDDQITPTRDYGISHTGTYSDYNDGDSHSSA